MPEIPDCIFLDYSDGGFFDEDLASKYIAAKRRFPWNPHGITEYAEASRREIIRSANRILSALGIRENEADVIWTGTGTEALNLGIHGYLASHPGTKVEVMASAHHGMLRPAERAALPEKCSGILRCGILVNNETGRILDENWFYGVKNGNCLLDGCQAIGRIPFSWRAWHSPEMLAISGKKLGTPMQIGALIVKHGLELSPQILGGGQQSGLRGGSLDAASCSVFADAVELAVMRQSSFVANSRELRRQLKQSIGQACPFGVSPVIFEAEDAHQCPSIMMFSIPGYEGALLARILGHDYHIQVGTGAACSAESGETSHVLADLGVAPEISRGALRVSFGHGTTSGDIEKLGLALRQAIEHY